MAAREAARIAAEREAAAHVIQKKWRWAMVIRAARLARALKILQLALRRYEPAAMFTHSRGRWNEKPGMTLLCIGVFIDCCLTALVLRLHAQQVKNLE